MGKVKTMIYKLLKNKEENNKWLPYYDEEHNTIEFTEKSIYEYMYNNVKNDLDFYALNYFNTRITFGELLNKIEKCAKSLKRLGVEKGDVVTICMPNTPEAVFMFYATNKIGAIADMVHPLSSPVELEHYLNESKSKILMLYDMNYYKYKETLDKNYFLKRIIITSVSESMSKTLKLGYNAMNLLKFQRPTTSHGKLLSYQDFIEMSHFYRKDTKETVSFRDTAIILHSGGTTGVPKGIMLSNYNFNAEAQQGGVNVQNVRPRDKIVTLLPIFHGFGLGVCLHCPLTVRAEVILMPEFNMKNYYNIIRRYKPNVLAGVPTLWEGMMSSNLFDNVDLSCLKYVISGGDHLPQALEDGMNKFLKAKGATIKISKGYGMTESVAATAYTFENVNKVGSIGIPMVGNSFCITDVNTGKILKANEEGEICVNGPTIMQGYLNNKEETDNVIKVHKDGKKWLHTGDVGYIDEDGVIFFTQRLKRIIVSSGFNVYPSQIEEVLMKHPKVESVCVIGIPHPYKMHVPKAFIVLKKGYKENVKLTAELRLLCKKELAAYSQVKNFEYIDSLPQTLYKKIDYKALEKMEEQKQKKQAK